MYMHVSVIVHLVCHKYYLLVCHLYIYIFLMLLIRNIHAVLLWAYGL